MSKKKTSEYKKYKLEKKHLDYYKKRVLYWLKELGVSGWTVYFDLEDVVGGYASIDWNFSGRVCTFNLSREWLGLRPTNKCIDRSALHECLHLLLTPFNVYAKERYLDEEVLDNEREKVVIMLENFIAGGSSRE